MVSLVSEKGFVKRRIFCLFLLNMLKSILILKRMFSFSIRINAWSWLFDADYFFYFLYKKE